MKRERRKKREKRFPFTCYSASHEDYTTTGWTTTTHCSHYTCHSTRAKDNTAHYYYYYYYYYSS